MFGGDVNQLDMLMSYGAECQSSDSLYSYGRQAPFGYIFFPPEDFSHVGAINDFAQTVSVFGFYMFSRFFVGAVADFAQILSIETTFCSLECRHLVFRFE
ncbi:hypothetical protein BaRGS_00000431 [Batillaria attramentaria]|uniref:Uncharacterized protein n=1 Tax=Batillaria attramentaria TaxID=370345 RepID=A0ABD0M9E9_9CAEN